MSHAREIGVARLELVCSDITRETTDAIVNAANSSLLGGGGVDGAIHRAAGPALLEECRRIRERAWPDGLPPGEAVLTGAGRLTARHVVHTVGPIWHGGTRDEPLILARCYRNSLALADANGLASVAFPSISTGAFGYPLGAAARVALRAVRDGLATAKTVRLVRFALFGEGDLVAYAQALDELPEA